MTTSFAAFRFALVGFTLPYMFVLRPALLMLDSSGEPARWGAVLYASVLGVLGIVPLAAAIAGYLFRPVSWPTRLLLLLAALLLLVPGAAISDGALPDGIVDGVGLALLVGVALVNWRRGSAATART
jgi:TRAP-type uncharacterized transport system fused permease subunit